MHSLPSSEDTQNVTNRNLRDSIMEQTLASEKEGFDPSLPFPWPISLGKSLNFSGS